MLNIESPAHLAETVTGQPMTLVAFVAPWDARSQSLDAVLKQLEREYRGRIVVGRANVDRLFGSAERLGVAEVPALALFKGGAIVARLPVYHDVARMRPWLERFAPAPPASPRGRIRVVRSALRRSA